MLEYWDLPTTCYVISYFHMFSRMKGKKSKTPNTSDLMLKARVVNFFKNIVTSSMKDSKESLKCISSLTL